MEVNEIIVSAGRTFNHPYESYSNLRPQVTLKATLSPGEDAVAATRQLQQTAEKVVEEHKQHLLDSIEELMQLQRAEREIADLGRSIQRQQEKLDELRGRYPGVVQRTLDFAAGDDAASECGEQPCDDCTRDCDCDRPI